MHFLKSHWFLGTAGLILGAAAVLAARFFLYAPEQVHYHANFAVYINGTRDEFKDPSYYQEVSACNALQGLTQPIQRAHMHDENNAVIHVHDHAVTWGQFFANLGWSLGPDFIEDAQHHLYTDGPDGQLHLVLNGRDITGSDVSNAVIRDRDRLLVSYGDGQNLMRQYGNVPASAKHFDETKDPASCSGAEKISWTDRLDHLLR